MFNKRRCVNIVSNYASIYAGNFIPSILHLVCSLKLDCSIVLSFPEEAKDRCWIKHIEKKGINVCFFREPKKLLIKDIKSINKVFKVNTLYSHFFSPFQIKRMYLFNRKMKLIIHMHSDFTGGKKNNLFFMLKKYFINKIVRKDARYIFVSYNMYLDYKLKKSVWIHNAYCKERILSKKIDLDRFKKDYGIHDGDTLLLFFGWSPYIKGVDIVVKAFLESNEPKTKLIIIYKRDNGKEIIDNYLKDNLGGKWFNNKNIIFLPPQEDIDSLYNLCDVFISSSRSEGFSYSILEAIIHGKMVYMSDIASTAWAKKFEYVYDYPVEDYHALAALINKKVVINNAIMSIRREKAVSDYNIDVWVKRIKDFLLKSN